jgi:NADH-quinone oxidoreductase subunit L
VIPLAILAILSIVGGYVGVPGSLGGSNRFDHFLGPVFRSTVPTESSQTQMGEKGATEQTTEGTEPKEEPSKELMFTGISVAAAFLGLGLAWLLYYRSPDLPARIAQRIVALYDVVCHKYYVDEIYAALIVKPLVNGSTSILWQGVDRKVIDDTVNNAADGARHVSDEVRHMQSGNLRSYAGWIAAGAAILIAYMVWLGVGR